jgi:hypothetical protein
MFFHLTFNFDLQMDDGWGNFILDYWITDGILTTTNKKYR